MKKRAFSPLYAFLYTPVALSARLFFRYWNVTGKEDFPKGKKPVIIVSNHQNALMDPLLACVVSPRQLHFLTRADVFKNKIFRKVVFAMNMLPVYRQHDKVDDMGGKNQKTFETAVARLENGAVVGIYPEGNHGNQKHLRPLKKGLARLIEIAANESDQLQEVQLVPVGIDYSEYDDARAGISVNFGKPFTVNHVLFTDEDPPVRYRKTMEVVKAHLSASMIDHSKEHYEVLRAAEHTLIFEKGYKNWNGTLAKLHEIKKSISSNLDPSVDELAKTTQQELDNHGTRFVDVLRAHHNKATYAFLLILLFPLSLPAFIFHYPLWLIIKRMIKKMVKDPVFVSTFKLVLSFALYPLAWLISVGVTSIFFDIKYVLIGLLGLLLSGIIALKVIDIWSDVQSKRNGKKFINSAPKAYEGFVKLLGEVQKILTTS
ncbi:MAG: 1-acyl-sn-glycerol-3-phosphate acyltransferase [Flavobacteriales bacterium]|nr:1-acyl-sn-glycerol-3-phosphate acyltransferase [Flavobacteriales bacterium]MDG1781238.1 1-acyl-sn-glycerol-3-phosphate acyltransferase [Flavobacteriales bacterium]MDG2245395.1 1-acyl-sn-glycerol-3-phosphate acyltransferase [Flavobacteriales bacterium]